MIYINSINIKKINLNNPIFKIRGNDGSIIKRREISWVNKIDKY